MKINGIVLLAINSDFSQHKLKKKHNVFTIFRTEQGGLEGNKNVTPTANSHYY